MRMMTRFRSALCLTALGGILMAAGSVGSAGSHVKQDKFNDNMKAGFWRKFNNGTTKVRETGKRLSFKTPGDEDLTTSGYSSRGWSVRGDENYTIKFDYYLNAKRMTSPFEEAAVGVYTTEQNRTVEVMVWQTGDGWFIELELMQNGQSVARKQKMLDSKSGKVEIKYTLSNDTIKVKVDGRNKLKMTNLYGKTLPTNIGFELIGRGFKKKFGYKHVWMDNFKVIGVIND